jgi:isopenicillin N synthase-like dioxygenase
VKRLIEATTTIGFFYAVEHDIDLELMANLRKQAGEFFTLTDEEKNAIHLSKSPHYRGYTAMDEEITQGVPDHKETLDFATHE